jgi:hypothetical protein
MIGVYVGYESLSIVKYIDPSTGEQFRARFMDCVFDETVFLSLATCHSLQKRSNEPIERLRLKRKNYLFHCQARWSHLFTPTHRRFLSGWMRF